MTGSLVGTLFSTDGNFGSNIAALGHVKTQEALEGNLVDQAEPLDSLTLFATRVRRREMEQMKSLIFYHAIEI